MRPEEFEKFAIEHMGAQKLDTSMYDKIRKEYGYVEYSWCYEKDSNYKLKNTEFLNFNEARNETLRLVNSKSDGPDEIALVNECEAIGIEPVGSRNCSIKTYLNNDTLQCTTFQYKDGNYKTKDENYKTFENKYIYATQKTEYKMRDATQQEIDYLKKNSQLRNEALSKTVDKDLLGNTQNKRNNGRGNKSQNFMKDMKSHKACKMANKIYRLARGDISVAFEAVAWLANKISARSRLIGMKASKKAEGIRQERAKGKTGSVIGG